MKNLNFRVSAIVCLAFGAICLTGCPDYSHLRTAPDYSSQKDPNEGDKGTATNTTGVPVPTPPGGSEEGPLDENGRPIE